MNYTITVTADELNLIGAALGKAPYEQVAGLMGKLKVQAVEQAKSVLEAPSEPSVTHTDVAGGEPVGTVANAHVVAEAA